MAIQGHIPLPLHNCSILARRGQRVGLRVEATEANAWPFLGMSSPLPVPSLEVSMFPMHGRQTSTLPVFRNSPKECKLLGISQLGFCMRFTFPFLQNKAPLKGELFLQTEAHPFFQPSF